MEQTTEEVDSLDIIDAPLTTRKTVKQGTYRSVYIGFKTFDDKTPWGIKKAVRLRFRIYEGEFQGSTVTYKGLMMKTNDKKWVIGSRSKLAEKVKKITKGGLNLGKDNEGTKVHAEVHNRKGKKKDDDGNVVIYDFVEDFIVDSDQTPVPEEMLKYHKKDEDTNESSTSESTSSETSPTEAKKPAVQEDLLGDMSDYDL